MNGVVNFLSTFVAFFFVDRFGRRLSLIAGGELVVVFVGCIF